MESALWTALIGFITACVGTFFSHRLVERRSHREFAEKYRNRLFEKQLTAYEALWKSLVRTSQYYDSQTIFRWTKSGDRFSKRSAKDFCEELTRLFFSEHGLYFSRSTRRAIFDLRNTLKRHIYKGNQEDDLIELQSADSKNIRKLVDHLTLTVRQDMGLRALRFRPEDIGVEESLLESD